MKAKEFKKLVEVLVARELERQLPVVVERVLSEKYIKRVLGERSDTRAFTHLVGDEPDEDSVPHALENDDDGVYEPSVLTRNQESTKIVGKLLSKDNPWSNLYEGMKPISRREADGDGLPSAPIVADPSKMKKLLEGMSKKSMVSGPVSNKNPDAEIERIRRLRESLDVPVGTQ